MSRVSLEPVTTLAIRTCTAGSSTTYLGGPACDHVHWYPIKETGGTRTNKDGVTRPTWNTYCARQSPGLFVRNDTAGKRYEYDAAVKVEELIGIDLGISREYSNSQSISYKIVGRRKKLCGNNDYPSLSGKLMERWRRRR